MKLSVFLLLMIAFSFAIPVHAADNGQLVKIFSPAGVELTSFTPFSGVGENAGSISSADLGQDGVAEILVGAGYGSKPLVRIFRQDGSLIQEFLAYGETFRGGVNVTACDLDDDGQTEVITGAGYSGGSHVRIFTSTGVPTGQQFFAYDQNFRGGVNVACGDITGDGTPDIVTGPGLGGGPHIKLFTSTGNLVDETFSGSAIENTGAYVSLADTDDDGISEVLASPMGYANPTIVVLAWKKEALRYRQSLPTGSVATHGTPAIGFDIDNNGGDEVAVSTGAFGTPHVAVYKLWGSKVGTTDTSLDTSSNILVLNRLQDAQGQKLLTLAATTQLTDTSGTKYIKVDISEQRLTAYENGVPVNTFLVSTGLPHMPTPLGVTTVTDKIPIKNYGWTYGPNNPGNYLLPNVKYNLRFRPMYYIHSAYWHNNFGQRMSHGCVNVSLGDAEWIYHWATVGTVVDIRE